MEQRASVYIFFYIYMDIFSNTKIVESMDVFTCTQTVLDIHLKIINLSRCAPCNDGRDGNFQSGSVPLSIPIVLMCIWFKIIIEATN